MTTREDRDIEKTAREGLGNFFYHMAELSFAGLVIVSDGQSI